MKWTALEKTVFIVLILMSRRNHFLDFYPHSSPIFYVYRDPKTERKHIRIDILSLSFPLYI